MVYVLASRKMTCATGHIEYFGGVSKGFDCCVRPLIHDAGTSMHEPAQLCWAF